MPDPSTSSGSPRPFDELRVVPSKVEGRAESRGDWASEVRARLSSVRLSPAREAEIIEELSQHLDDRWRELVAGGADPDVAVQLALAEFRGTDVLARYLAQVQNLRGGSELVIRASGDPYDVLPAVKSAVTNVLPDLEVVSKPVGGSCPRTAPLGARHKALVTGVACAPSGAAPFAATRERL